MAQRDEVVDRTGARPGLLPPLKGVAVLFGLLVLLQAFLAGQGLYVSADSFDAHRVIGEIAVIVALVLAVLAYLVLGNQGLGSAIFILSVVIFILTLIQIALGFSGRDSTTPAAWHVFNGVLIFGLTAADNMMIFRLGRLDR